MPFLLFPPESILASKTRGDKFSLSAMVFSCCPHGKTRVNIIPVLGQDGVSLMVS